jgi:type I restriction enzyme, S subunit
MELINKPNLVEINVGQIPHDWSVKSLKELGTWKGGGTPSKMDATFWNGNIPWVSPKDFNGIQISSSEDYITESAIACSATNLIDANSIIIVIRSGILRNRVPISVNLVPVAINQDVKALTVNKFNDINYVLYALINVEHQIRKKIVKVGTTVESVDFRSLKDFEIALPPTKEEQIAIATALSDTDALINSLEKLIAKKRAIKQGAMQELLKPKKGWKVENLGNCLLKNPDYGINAAAVAYKESLPTYLRITDISEDGRYMNEDRVSVNKGGADNYYLEEGDIVFARTGASVGKTYLYNSDDGKLVFAGFLIRVKTDKSILDPRYLFYFTQTKQYQAWVLSNSMRSGQPGLNSNEFKSLELNLPDMEMQKEIIAVLSDMDYEVKGLEAQLNKYRQIKSGMMQSLLTGKIRLV